MFPDPDEVPDFGDTVRSYMEQTKQLGYGFNPLNPDIKI